MTRTTIIKIILLFWFCGINVVAQVSADNKLVKKNPFLAGATQPVPVMVIAHRGASAYAPENTIAAFKKAVALGAEMFELDVHMSKDNVLVVVHDDAPTKTTDIAQKFPNRSSYRVADFTYQELRQLDAGSWYVKELNAKTGKFGAMSIQERNRYISQQDIDYYTSGKVKIPTLEESLEVVKKHKCYVNIEIKAVAQFYPGIAKKVVALVEKMHLVDRVLISSFDHYQVVECKKYNPNIATAILCAKRIYQPGNYCRKMVNADAFHPGCRGGADTVGFSSVYYRRTGELLLGPIDNALEMGVKVNVWTANDKERIEGLLLAGVDGIISDYPNRVRNIVNSNTPVTLWEQAERAYLASQKSSSRQLLEKAIYLAKKSMTRQIVMQMKIKKISRQQSKIFVYKNFQTYIAKTNKWKKDLLKFTSEK